MKKIKFIYGLMAAVALVFASCNVNDLPEFDDKDAFVAFTSPTASAIETDGTLEVSVMLTSLSGINGSVDFEIVTPEKGGAIEGKHYTIEGSKTLQFSGREGATQKIKFNIIDNDVFGGDVKMTINLVNSQGANLGAVKSCTVTIEDDEHPLAFILGEFKGVGASYFGGDLDWTVRLEKDATDLNKVWITNLVPNGSSSNSPVYGIVNADKTELLIPVKQETAISSSYPHIVLIAYDGESKEMLGDNVKCTIAADGTITIKDEFGAYVYGDDAMTEGLGWYERVLPGAVLTKK
ncbi:MAG: Calx-beta domain-containing protein [Prevotella sp.]|nr:Calx-beta domain-containing protein [Prevotella sp.]